jgi:AraC-like DNA-binding protein
VFDLQGYRYERIEPPPSLRGVVDHFWTFRGPNPGEGVLQLITPMSFGEIVLQYGDVYERGTGSTYCEEPRCGVFGPVLYTQQTRPRGAIDVLAARLTPTGLRRVCRMPVSETTGAAFSVMDVLARRSRVLWRALANAEPVERLACLRVALESLVRDEPMRAELRMTWILQQIHDRPGVRLAVLAERAGVSLRQLEYDFARVVGVSPREYRATVRIERAVQQLLRPRNVTLSHLAQELGYHDHAQFARDFGQRVGMSPGRFRRGHLGALFFPA